MGVTGLFARPWFGGAAMTVALFTLPSCADSTSRPSNSAVPDAQRPPLVTVRQARGVGWSQFRLEAPDRAVDAFLARDAQPKPVVVLLQGSGCVPSFTIDTDDVLHSTSLFEDLVTARLERFHFASVEKRGVTALQFAAGMTVEQKQQAFARAERECSAEFVDHETKDARVEDILALIRAVSGEPWARQIILAGHSEGTHVATGVLRRLKTADVAAAGLFASAGPIPFYGGYVAAGAGDRAVFQTTFDNVRMLMRADDDFMFRGHPARRWKSFWLDSTPLEDIRESTVPLFVAQGTRDGSILASDLFALEAVRQQPSRPLRYVVLQDGNHAFETPDRRLHLPRLFDDFLGWALDPSRSTSLAVMK
jgi:dienelactone hydrolase